MIFVFDCRFRKTIPLNENRCTHEGEGEKVLLIHRACSVGDFDVVVDLLPQLCETALGLYREEFIEQASKGRNNHLLRLLETYHNPFWERFQTAGDYENAKQQLSVDRADIATFLRFISMVPFFLRPFIRWTIERPCLEHFSQIVERTTHEYGKDKCNEVATLWETFLQKRCMWSFLRVYTLTQPPMSTIIRNRSCSYSTLIYMNLHRMKGEERAFSGISYRGAVVSATDLITYLAAKGRETLVEMKSFYSTSKSRSIAELYGGDPNATDNEFPALFIFDFTPKACATAIDLVKKPLISKFEVEEEVLLLPYTMFRVLDVRRAGYIDEFGFNRWIITLVNVPVPKRHFMSFLWERTNVKNEADGHSTLEIHEPTYSRPRFLANLRNNDDLLSSNIISSQNEYHDNASYLQDG